MKLTSQTLASTVLSSAFERNLQDTKWLYQCTMVHEDEERQSTSQGHQGVLVHLCQSNLITSVFVVPHQFLIYTESSLSFQQEFSILNALHTVNQYLKDKKPGYHVFSVQGQRYVLRRKVLCPLSGILSPSLVGVIPQRLVSLLSHRLESAFRSLLSTMVIVLYSRFSEFAMHSGYFSAPILLSSPRI